MAMLPQGCALIDNPVGAPGFSIGGIFAFPGFPKMLQPMFTNVLAQLEAATDKSSGGDFSLLRTQEAELATSEGVIADIVETWAAAHPDLKVGIYPSNAHLNRRCKLVMRFRCAVADDAAEQAALAAWAALLQRCGEQAAIVVEPASQLHNLSQHHNHRWGGNRRAR